MSTSVPSAEEVVSKCVPTKTALLPAAATRASRSSLMGLAYPLTNVLKEPTTVNSSVSILVAPSCVGVTLVSPWLPMGATALISMSVPVAMEDVSRRATTRPVVSLVAVHLVSLRMLTAGPAMILMSV